MDPLCAHYLTLRPIQGPQDNSEAIFWPHFGILNNFPHFLWMNNSIEYSGLYWMNIFLNEYFGFCFEWIFFWMNILDFVLNWILNWIIFRPNSMKKWIFKTYRTGLLRADFQSGSRVLKRCSEPFLIYIYGIQCDFMPKSCWKHSNFENR